MKVYLDLTEHDGEPRSMIDKDEDLALLHRQVNEDILEFGPIREIKDASHADIRAQAGSPARAGERLESSAVVVRKSDTYAGYGIGDVEDSSSVQHETTARPEKFRQLENHSDAETDGGKDHNPRLLSWLDQSIPNSPQVSAVEMIRQEKESETLVAKQLEVKEMEFFRSVHLSTESSDKSAISCHAGDKPTETQLYLRNILDRYPLMPLYLANRLAIANESRAERLRKLRLDHKEDRLRSSSTIQDANGRYRTIQDDHHHMHDHDITLKGIDRISTDQNGTSGHLPSDPKESLRFPSSLISVSSGSCEKSREKEEQNSKGEFEQAWDKFFHEHSALGRLLRGLYLLLIEKIEPCDSLLITPQKMQRFYERFKLPVEAYPWQVVFDDESSSISRMYRDLRCQHHLVQGENFNEKPVIPALTPLGFHRWVTALIQAHPYEEFSRLAKIFLGVSTTDPRLGKGWLQSDFARTIFALSPRQSAHELLEESIREHCLDLNSCEICLVASNVSASRANLMLILTIWQESRERDDANELVEEALVVDDAAGLQLCQIINNFAKVLSLSLIHSGRDPCELYLWIKQSAEVYRSDKVFGRVFGTAAKHDVDEGSDKCFFEKKFGTGAEYERSSKRGSNSSHRAASPASSVHSRSSSRNSTLHGSSEFDPSEQMLDDREVSACANGSTDSVSQSLNFEVPYPPKELGLTFFECDICGKEVFIEGRRAWK